MIVVPWMIKKVAGSKFLMNLDESSGLDPIEDPPFMQSISIFLRKFLVEQISQ